MSEISVDKPDPTDTLGIDNPALVNSEHAFDGGRVPTSSGSRRWLLCRGLAPGAPWSLSIHNG